MGKGWPGQVPGSIEIVAQIGLRVLLLLEAANGYERTITAGQALDIEHLREVQPIEYRSKVYQDPDRRAVTFAFDTLQAQGLAKGTLDVGNALFIDAYLTADGKARLDAKDTSGVPRIDVIRRALDAVKAGTPPPPGTFTALTHEIGFEP